MTTPTTPAISVFNLDPVDPYCLTCGNEPADLLDLMCVEAAAGIGATHVIVCADRDMCGRNWRAMMAERAGHPDPWLVNEGPDPEPDDEAGADDEPWTAEDEAEFQAGMAAYAADFAADMAARGGPMDPPADPDDLPFD